MSSFRDTVSAYAFAYADVLESGMVKEPKRNRVIRVPDSLWDRARLRADEKGETVSEAVRKFLERYSR